MAKNYLFAPFKDDEDKINTFNHLKRYLPKGHRSDLIMFIGRLESYYDVIIEELQADITHDAKVCYDVDDEHIKIIDELKAEHESLQDQLKDAVNDYESLLNSNGVK